MTHEHKDSRHTPLTKNKTLLAVGAAVLLLGTGTGCFFLFRESQTQPSVANFCRVQQEETARLRSLPKPTGYPYGEAIFPSVTASAPELVQSLNHLESVSPNDVRPYIQTLRTVFEKVDQDPTAGGASIYANTEARAWMGEHCGQQ